MSDTKSNPYTLIAGFLLPWKVTKNSTRKEHNQTTIKSPVRGYCLCPNASKTPRGLSLCQGKFWQQVINSKSQKLFDFSIFLTFRLFELFEFFDFSSRNLMECELFDFSIFWLFDFSRSKNVIFTVWPLPARRAHKVPCVCAYFGLAILRTKKWGFWKDFNGFHMKLMIEKNA